jgi:hypothetical protein
MKLNEQQAQILLQALAYSLNFEMGFKVSIKSRDQLYKMILEQQSYKLVDIEE